MLSGTFAYTWTPTISGQYKIIATFAGSDAYGSSSATTNAVVIVAPTPSAPTVTNTSAGLATTSDLLTYIALAVIAMIITVAVATVLILRKH